MNGAFDRLRCLAGKPERPVLVGFSGGLDSTVLLHLLKHAHADLRAIHAHHGLQVEADSWAAHCRAVCEALGVPLTVVRVAVDRSSGLGVEGAARAARRAAFAEALGDDEILALAHHLEDQAETFLLRALRGSGADGLAAMRPWRRYASGWMWRPLLDVSRAELERYASERGLRWIDDPSNASDTFDRNFLRHRVLPALRERWPKTDAALARSAALCAQASDLLTEEDAAVLERSHGVETGAANASLLSVSALTALAPPRRARVLRLWTTQLGLPPLPPRVIDRIEAELLRARPDARSCCDWSGARIARWRDLLHAASIPAQPPAHWQQDWDGASALVLPGGDTLALIGAARFDTRLQVRYRRGGERIVLPGRTHSHALKHVLQDLAVPPWQRERLPLLFDEIELLAAGERIVSARMQAWLSGHEARLRWVGLA